MHLVCKEDPRYRFLPKTFSNCNQLVASFLKHFDHIVWKELISVKTFFSYKTTKQRKQKKK